MSGLTLDAGALIALDRRDRRVLTLIARAQETAAPIAIPGPALAQAVRQPERQALLARLIRAPGTEVVPLGRVDAVAVGRLLRDSRTSDIADAHVVVCAQRLGGSVVTSDPDDIAALNPSLPLITV